MKRVLIASLLCAFAAGSVHAADASAAPAKPKTAQQQRMTDCNAEAKTKALKGAERKTFMSSCLKGESTAAPTPAAAEAATPAKSTQQQKMSSCNAEAKTKALKGAERKTFMSSCLKG